ncbi:hypothetical protein [Nocardia arthritidis]|uniref:Uncharacterized protein n=1 Tax=Nocardia arthritidis TaxID=228602 RepID=A0A6G9YTJ4_9NOCA|nr:hypothetical protein [Nocardia arthritidis]QIS16213.1 hypothetical protein F5544_42020 [Nocardia arthritidis]
MERSDNEFPWFGWLPEEARAQCAAELLACARDDSVTGSARLDRAVIEWRATAEIYAEPELLRRLRGPFETDESVEVVRPVTRKGFECWGFKEIAGR